MITSLPFLKDIFLIKQKMVECLDVIVLFENLKTNADDAVSLDRHIADADGGAGWLAGEGSDTDSFSRFIEIIDTLVLGYNTYHQIVTELSPDD